MNKNQIIKLIICIGIAVVIWFIPVPEGLDPAGWHLLALFVATIVALILQPLPMGSIAIIAITAVALLIPFADGDGNVTYKQGITTALSGFSNTTIWLIVCAFFISRGFIKTGLGSRIAYMLVRKFGKSTLGLSYALALGDLALAPATPSNTARGGGVIYPIVRALSESYGSRPDDGTGHKIGSFLTLTAFQVNMITSAMFLTAMAANPLAQGFAAEQGIEITWGGWFIAALVPGIVSLIVIPLFIYKINPPEIKQTPGAAKFATEKLNEMGKMSTNEIKMLCVFFALIFMWVFKEALGGLDATLAAFIGLSALLVLGVLDLEDIKNEKGAWDTLLWFSALVMMATQLSELGVITWFSENLAAAVDGLSWGAALIVLAVAYYYSHYMFASATAHVTAMYPAFLAVAISCGAPPMLAAILLGMFGNLMCATTTYGGGPAPVFFGSGYVSAGKWWSTGFFISIIHMIIWLGVGFVWWKIIGLY